MRPGPFLILLLVTLAVSVAATASYLARQDGDAVVLDGTAMLPGLAGRLDAVAEIEVVTGGGGYTLERRNGGWVSPEDHGYSVQERRVNRLLAGLAGLEKLEPKTERPELYPRIHVEDPDGPEAASRLVRLKDGQGAVLAELIVGKQRHARTGRADHGTYVRRPGEARAWLGAGLVDLWDDTYPWLDSMIVDVEPGAIAEIEIAPAFGRPLRALRPEEGAEAMGVAGVPPGRRLDREAVRQLGALLTGIRFDAVRPAAQMADAAVQARATVRTFDGRLYEIEVRRDGGAPWLTVAKHAAAEADTAASAKIAATAPRLDGWAFRVQDYIARRLGRSLDDLLVRE